ncbi:porin [Alphaproteobacteria bacterium]|nr:porin [Alphaproteobacteria bacterium]
MRKVLLATTALVAMSVTAAQADVSISGGMDFQYTTSDSADDAASVDGNITIKGSMITDTGLTVTVTQNNALQVQSLNTAATMRDSQVEDAFMTVAGDFGTLILGQTDMVNDRNDGALGINNDVFSLEPVTHGTLIGTDTSDSTAANIGFESPTMNGLKVYAGAVPAGGSQLGANFSIAGLSMHVQTATGFAAGQDEVSIGAKGSFAGATIAVGSKQEDASGTKTDSSDFAIKYPMTDTTTVSFLYEEGSTGTTKHEKTSIEAKYTITPGLDFYIGTSSIDTAGTTDSGAAAALSVSF